MITLVKKISRACGSLVKLRNCVEIETLREVYHALIHSYLRYGIIAWGTAAKTSIKKLQTIINRAIRIMAFVPNSSIDLNPLFEILEILKLDDIYNLELAKFTFKDAKKILPITIAKYFETREVRSSQRTRNRTSSTTHILHNTAIGSKSIQIRSKEFWNKVPDEIKDSPNISCFKRRYKSHLLLLNLIK